MTDLITTTKGLLPRELLEERSGTLDNANETTRWVEYWLDGELVHRSVDVVLKPQAVADTSIGNF